MLTAIIVAAGSSRRLGRDKLFAELLGRPVIAQTLDAFERAKCVSEIIVVTRAEKVEELRRLEGNKPRRIVEGGERRQDSVAAGLAALGAETQFVAVHDGARPLVTAELIESVLARAQQMGAASAAEPVNDTLKRVDAQLLVNESVDRRQLYAMQTPQIFERGLLQSAYRAVAAEKLQITDEVSAVQYFGHQVALVPSDDFNFKITYARDLVLAAMVLRSRGTGGTSSVSSQE